MDLNPLTHLNEAEPDVLTDEPIIVLNLLKFKSEEAVEGYLDYGAAFLKSFGQRGAEVLYCGRLMEKVQGDAGDWDVVLLVRYPNRQFFYAMMRSDEYQSFSPLRENALTNAVLQPSEAILPYRTQAVEFDGGAWLPGLQARISGD